MTYTEALAEEIREQTAARGQLARHVAAALDLAEISYSQRLRGQVDWRLDELEKLAAYFGFDSAADLLAAAKARRLAHAS